MLSDPAPPVRLKEFRMRRGWTQGELAQRAGISRAAVSAIEIHRMVPSVAAALKLAACLECTVENLFGTAPPAATNEWAWAPHAAQSRFWQAEVDGRILFYPCEETASGVLAHDGIASREPVARHGAESSDGDPSRTLVVAGCDPAASLLAAEYARQTGQRMIVLRRSSGAALRLLKQRRVHVAGVHLSAAAERHGNASVVTREIGLPVLLLRLAQWEEGIAFPTSQRVASIRGLLKKRLRWVGREPGSGARQCLDELLPPHTKPSRIAFDHRAVATALASGWADAGVCVRLVSEEAGLRFLAVRTENYDLTFLKSSQTDPRVEALVRVVRSPAYRQLLSELPGYHVGDAGGLEATNGTDAGGSPKDE